MYDKHNICACHCFKESQRKSEQIEQIFIKNVKSPKDSILLPAETHLSKYKTAKVRKPKIGLKCFLKMSSTIILGGRFKKFIPLVAQKLSFTK